MDSKKEKEKENETQTPSSFSTRFIGLTAGAKLKALCEKCSDQPVLLKELKELAVILVDNDKNDPMVGAHKWVMSSQTWLLLKDSKDSQTIYESMIKDFPKASFEPMSGFSRESIENQLLKMIQSQRFKTLYDKAVYLRTGKQSENRAPELQYPISDTIQAALWLLDEMGLSDIERLSQHQDLYEANLKKG